MTYKLCDSFVAFKLDSTALMTPRRLIQLCQCTCVRIKIRDKNLGTLSLQAKNHLSFLGADVGQLKHMTLIYCTVQCPFKRRKNARMLNSSKDTGIQYCTVNIVYLEQGPTFDSVFRIRIRTDPHKEMPPGSGSGSASRR